MAFAKGKESKEFSNELYVGVAPVSVLAVNPTAAELSKIYDREIENEPDYKSEIEIDGAKTNQTRIDFIVKVDEEKTGINCISKISFFVANKIRGNKDNTKIQIIDKYGRTAWATREEFEARQIPQYASGPANIDADYRGCYIGEEDLTNFVINYLGLPPVMNYKNGNWVMSENPQESEARFDIDSINNILKGDVKDLKDIINYQPNNKVKALFGVRHSNNNTYQTVYSTVLKLGATNYSKLEKEVNNRKNGGGLSTSEFYFGDITVYTVQPTNFTESQKSPFDTPQGIQPGAGDMPW